MQPTVRPFFDPATRTVSYVVYQLRRAECAVIDSVLDCAPPNPVGRRPQVPPRLPLSFAGMNCVSSGCLRLMRTPTIYLLRQMSNADWVGALRCPGHPLRAGRVQEVFNLEPEFWIVSPARGEWRSWLKIPLNGV